MQKANLPIMTNALRKRTRLTLRALKTVATVPFVLEKRLENLIDAVIYKINMEFNLKTKQAPFITTVRALQIANALWQDDKISRGVGWKAIRTRKRASTALVLAAYTGGRWIDIHRLKWEDLKISKTPTKTFLIAEMRMSKNNLCNEVPQRLSWARSPDTDSPDNPINWLMKYWETEGKPKKGFIFRPDIDTPIEKWGNATIKQVQKAAKNLKVPEIPTKHSPRVTMAVTLFNMGVKKSRINRFMNWKTSQMQERYINTRDAQLSGAPAHRLSSMTTAKLQAVQKYLI